MTHPTAATKSTLTSDACRVCIGRARCAAERAWAPPPGPEALEPPCPACGVHWIQPAAPDACCLACRLGARAASRFGDPERHAKEVAAVGDGITPSAWRPVSPDLVFAARGSCSAGKGALYLPDFVFSLPHAIICLDILTNCHRDEPPSFCELQEGTYQGLATLGRPVVFLYTNFGSYYAKSTRLHRQEDPKPAHVLTALRHFARMDAAKLHGKRRDLGTGPVVASYYCDRPNARPDREDQDPRAPTPEKKGGAGPTSRSGRRGV
eukprot:tig00001375_g8516.t1